MSTDYTQDFIDEVKGVLGEAEEEIAVDLVPYAPKQCPILGTPTFQSRVVLNPTIFPSLITSETTQFEIDWLPFRLYNASQADDSADFKNTIRSAVGSMFRRPELINMYSRLIQSNNFPTASDLMRTINEATTKMLLDEFTRIEVRGIDYYCAYYVLQRLPRLTPMGLTLDYSYKLSWDGSNGKRYYTILSFTLDNETIDGPAEVTVSDILVEGAGAGSTVQIVTDSEVDVNGVVSYIESDIAAFFATVISACDYADNIEFAKNVDEFKVEFLYQSDGTDTYGVTVKREMRFTRNAFFYEKQDQNLTWPRFCDFSYIGKIESDTGQRVVEVTYSYVEEDYSGGTGDFTFRTGSIDYVWA